VATIKRISALKDLPIFQDFMPSADLPQLRKHNLIYGFNGCGKTTISRILSSLQQGAIDEHLPAGAKFSIELDDGSVITESERLDAVKDRIVVFNEDFIARCIRWHDGTAAPVYYIGRNQAELSKKLEALEESLKKYKKELDSKKLNLDRAKRAYSTFNRDRAGIIAETLGLGRKYMAPHLISDYGRGPYGNVDLRSDDERSTLRRIIFQDAPLPKLELLAFPDADIATLVSQSVEVLTASVGEVVVKDLQDHPLMLNWVKDGLNYHKQHELGDCLFCGNALTEERRENLDALIDDRFNQLTARIAQTRDEVANRLVLLQQCLAELPAAAELSQLAKSLYETAAAELKEIAEWGVTKLSRMQTKLQEKTKAPNIPIEMKDLPSKQQLHQWQASFVAATEKIRSAIIAHNEAHSGFAQSQEDARNQLKQHFLAELQHEYEENDKVQRDAETALEAHAELIAQASKQVEELKHQVRQHGPAAEVINSLLKAYLGHDELAIYVRDDEESGYEIKRRGVLVRGTLSQGERTALALCYFLTGLEAENRKLKDLIVVIDDPVSSLDTRALNYAFTLIKSSLTNAAQLILITHNLPFMNETKKWLRNRAKQMQAQAPEQPRPATAAMWLIDSRFDTNSGSRQSRIVPLPNLLRDYDSEYHYVFSLALAFSTEGGAQDAYFYMMPNILRKVLEIFLTFKYPGPDGLGSKVDAVSNGNFGIDSARLRAIERLLHLESHADSLDDLISFSSITIEEARDAADSMLIVMQALDKDHVNRLKARCRA